jgi:uncharacterized membrane protein SpoIIM required for sporulation
MISAQWIRKRQAAWSRLEELIDACGRSGVSSLHYRDLEALALLYRQTGADLSAARADTSSADLARRLNDLMARAHNLLYTAHRERRHPVWHFYTRQFPRVFRACWREVALATALFVLGGLMGAGLSATVPGFTRFLVGAEMVDTIERRQMWTHSIVAMKPLAASGIMTNNIAVSLSAFATGIFGGLGTSYFMVFNGVLIGVIGMACFDAGMSVSLWSFVAPHGALELPAIFIAGGAGFVLGRGLLVPGLRPRRDALARAGREAVQLLLGVFPLLVVAGLIEGFISPVAFEPSLKFLLGAALTVMLAAYLFWPRPVNAITPDSVP